MTQELWIAVWAAVLGGANILLAPVAAMSRPGYAQWNAGPRDQPFDTGPVAQRLNRAFSNFMETYVFFAIIVIALAFSGKSSQISIWGAWLYLAARILYIPCYAFGITYVRSMIFLASLVGLLMCLYTLLF